MKISSNHLSRFTKIPNSSKELRLLLDDIGVEVKKVEPVGSDTLYTLELLANRGDHYSYEGVAREISGRTGHSLNAMTRTPLTVGDGPIEIRSETPDCLVYTVTLMKRNAYAPGFPPELIRPLTTAGINSISSPVDATNLVNLELGQPTHAFDADKIDGGIVIRDSLEGEKAWPLFTDEPMTLPAGILVIADTTKILAIAGVIGCEESKADEETQKLLIESATFDPVRVRKASRILGIHTDSSARFERGADPTYPLVGTGRVVYLLQEYGGWSLKGTSALIGTWVDPHRQILLSIANAASFLEYPLTSEEAKERLSRYGFIVSKPYPDWTDEPLWDPKNSIRETSRERLKNSVLVQVPPHRLWDVEFAADLFEELAKSIGYNNTPERLPQIDMGSLPSSRQVTQSKVADVLHGYGFFEVFTDGFYARETRTKLGIDETHPLWTHVETTNALERGYSLLKNNNIAQALDTVSVNLNRKNSEIKAYEFTRTFHLDDSAVNGVCSERSVLWAIASGNDRLAGWSKTQRAADSWFLKGLLAELSLELKIDLKLESADTSDPHHSLLHPNRQASVTLNGEIIGILGEIHPSIVQNWRIKRDTPCFLQLDMDAIVATENKTIAYIAPGTFHSIARSLAFTLHSQTEAGSVANYMMSSGPDWLHDVEMVDLYEHEENGTSARTITYALTFFSGDEKRTTEEVNTACEYLIKAVHERFADQGVKLRA